jgi:hypothetical protein
VVTDLIKFLDSLNVRPYDRLLILENSDVSVNLNIGKLLVVEVSEGGGYLIFTLVIEEDVISMCVIINLELGPHGLLKAPQKPTDHNHIVHRLPIELADVIRPGLGLKDHFQSHWSEYFLPSRLALVPVVIVSVSKATAAPTPTEPTAVPSFIIEA